MASPVPKLATSISPSWENVSLSPNAPLQRNSSYDIERSIEKSDKEDAKLEENSAEAIAKSLLKKFDGRKLPAASELKWMVAEDQVPQTLLPLPSAWPISPDDADMNAAKLNEEDQTLLVNSKRITLPVSPIRFYSKR